MASKKTWISIIVGGLAACVIALLAVAGFGVYLVASHIDTMRTTSADAFRQFDEAKAALKDQKPLYEMDQRERPRMTRQLSTMPTVTTEARASHCPRVGPGRRAGRQGDAALLAAPHGPAQDQHRQRLGV